MCQITAVLRNTFDLPELVFYINSMCIAQNMPFPKSERRRGTV